MKMLNQYVNTFRNIHRIMFWAICCAACFTSVSCKKFLQVEVPKSNVEKEVVFKTDAMATAAVLGMYYQMMSGSGGEPFASGRSTSLMPLTGLTADELTHPSRKNLMLMQFEHNAITPLNNDNLDLWTSLYEVTYQANTIIEGLEQSTSLTKPVKDQLLGESYFVRAFCHFYLANLYGDVPLLLTSDYTINRAAPRTAKEQVLTQVTNDLLKAYPLLEEAYVHANAERIRVNKFAAAAMLARTYLYTKEWSKAEQYATAVIDKTSLYSLQTDVTKVFLKNNPEAIWQLWTGNGDGTQNGATSEAVFFTPDYAIKDYSVCTNSLVNAFEIGDIRYTEWVRPVPGNIYTPYKYRQNNYYAPVTEYSTVIRLAELYLIRAEARAMQNKLVGANSAASDIDKIRVRAQLSPTPATTQESLLTAIMQERRVELFTEWGHRWFDLKRWGKAGAVLSALKGTDWQSTDVLYPIPQGDMLKNPNLRPQNDGY